MKMELIVALLHNPKVLFLDEPTIGLDAVAQRQIRSFLKQVNEEKGTTILLTSHYMDDIKSLCKRCVVINHGVKIFDGETINLFEKYQKNKKITVCFEQEVKFKLPKSCTILTQEPDKLVFHGKKEIVKEVVKDLMENYDLEDIVIEKEDIGEVVERIYSQKGDA